jgi:hypothetical protein
MKRRLNETEKEFKARRARKLLRCSICPPNRGENAKRKPKHGVKKKRKPRDRR